MIRRRQLFEKICDIENIRFAHYNAQKGKKHYREVRMINANPDEYLHRIRDQLLNQTFKNSEYKIITKKTDNGKIREIFKLPYFPDRIIHHCILQIIGPIWLRSLIRDTYSSIKGRGIHDGVERIKKALRDADNTRFCLKLDVKKFYPSIDNEILKQVIRRKIKDSKLLWLLDEIINSTKGVPIGNYLSQHFGNLYLSSYDHWMKEIQRCRYYFRYCDDIIILAKDKAELHLLKDKTENYLADLLKLNLKENWQIFPVDDRGIDFLGYRFFHKYVLLRKGIKKNFLRRIKKINNNWQQMSNAQIINAVMSYYGWLKHGNCKHLFNKYVNKDLFVIFEQICKERGIANALRGIR